MNRRLIYILIGAVLVWIGLVAYFTFDRGLVCTPLFSLRCITIGWEQFGDIVLLDWAYNWQPLLAGVVALIAAIIGGTLLNYQTRQFAAHEKERLARQERASRAIMPLALSTLSRYASVNASALRKIYDQAIHESVPRNAEIPKFERAPKELVSEIKEIVLHSPTDIGVAFSKILLRIQLHETRVESLPEEIRSMAVHKSTIESYIFDVAYIYAGSSNLFDYARQETNSPPEKVSWANIYNALNLLHFRSDGYSDLFATVSRRKTQPLVP